MLAFAVRAFYESLKFRPAGKKCQVEFVGYANERLYCHGLPQSGSVRLQLRHAFVFRFNQKMCASFVPNYENMRNLRGMGSNCYLFWQNTTIALHSRLAGYT